MWVGERWEFTPGAKPSYDKQIGGGCLGGSYCINVDIMTCECWLFLEGLFPFADIHLFTVFRLATISGPCLSLFNN